MLHISCSIVEVDGVAKKLYAADSQKKKKVDA
jgi:hypothetical protein